MRDAQQIVEELRSVIGLPDLAFDASGNLTLIFDGKLALNLARIDESSVELWTTLPDLRTGSGTALLTRLLEANHLGEGTGTARLALQPNGGMPVLCERLDAASIDAEGLRRRLSDFVRHATFWRSAAAAQAPSGAPEAGSDFEFHGSMLRA